MKDKASKPSSEEKGAKRQPVVPKAGESNKQNSPQASRKKESNTNIDADLDKRAKENRTPKGENL